MQRESWSWSSTHLHGPARVARWGHYGAPVIIFPSAGGDFEEVERFHLIGALRGLIDSGRIKVFSVDGVATRTWLRGNCSLEDCVKTQNAYEAYIVDEVVPLIRRDCSSESLQTIAAGAAFGAHTAVVSLYRKPEAFRAAIALSGIFDLPRRLSEGSAPPVHFVSPLYPGHAGGPQYRQCFVTLASGEGDYETPLESTRMAQALSSQHIPNHLELWGRNFAHGWATWREMLPRYVAAQA